MGSKIRRLDWFHCVIHGVEVGKTVTTAKAQAWKVSRCLYRTSCRLCLLRISPAVYFGIEGDDDNYDDGGDGDDGDCDELDDADDDDDD
eukprot:3642199-Amphidinium_carterae.1